jgi:putative ATPase
VNTVLREQTFASCARLQLVQGDITSEQVDAVVNAANARLAHGGGVAGAIVRAGGDAIQRESDAWVREHGPVPHAHPAWTSGGRLPARMVIHAVGPMWGEGGEDAKLAEAVRGTLSVAAQLGVQTVAMPALSTGIFGFPRHRAAGVILSTLEAGLAGRTAGPKLVRLVLFDGPTIEAFVNTWNDRWGRS